MLGFFPWEKWLPPYVIGPLICIVGACTLTFARDQSWWGMAACIFCVIFGAWGTWVWFSARRNIFDLTDRKK